MDVLANFIRFLETNGLVTFDILGDGEEEFVNRFKIQKYVYLAKRFGLDVPYMHGMYLRGPYSKTLAKAYYGIANNPQEYGRADGSLDEGFDGEGFLNAVYSKEKDWLEVAATLIDRNGQFKDRNGLVENVMLFKEKFGRKFMFQVLDDLEKVGLVKLTLVS